MAFLSAAEVLWLYLGRHEHVGIERADCRRPRLRLLVLVATEDGGTGSSSSGRL